MRLGSGQRYARDRRWFGIRTPDAIRLFEAGIVGEGHHDASRVLEARIPGKSSRGVLCWLTSEHRSSDHALRYPGAGASSV